MPEPTVRDTMEALRTIHRTKFTEARNALDHTQEQERAVALAELDRGQVKACSAAIGTLLEDRPEETLAFLGDVLHLKNFY